jgi:predicted phosphodiesterase
MKVIAIGDIHGRTVWKDIVEKETFDKVIFIGDYFDTHEKISPEQQKTNFKEIITYKKAHMDKVVLLLGNHDFHYLRDANETYSGYQMWHKTDIGEMLHAAIDQNLMKMCHSVGFVLFSHAGITKTWCENNLVDQGEFVEDSINELFRLNQVVLSLLLEEMVVGMEMM